MVDFLKLHFANNDCKEHYFIDEAITAAERRLGRQEVVIKPCRKHHVIAVNKEGVFAKSLYFRKTEIIENLFATHSVTGPICNNFID